MRAPVRRGVGPGDPVSAPLRGELQDEEPAEPATARHRPGGVDPAVAEGSGGRRRSALTWPVVALHLGVIVGLGLLALVMWWRVWVSGHPAGSIVCQCNDPSEELSYLAWMPYAVAHLHNPFLDNAIYAGQGGVNMLVNTSAILPAALLAPVTWLFGPIASFNVAVTLAPVVTGWCFFLAARRVTTFVPGQVVATVLYAFAPSVVTPLEVGHYFLALLFFWPLVFLLLHELFVRRRWAPVPVGVGLGLLVVAQFFTATEVLAIGLVGTAVGVVVAWALARPLDRELRRQVAVGLGTAAVTASVLLAYPLWFAVAGPRRVVGIAWPGTPGYGGPVSSIVDPGPGYAQGNPLARLSGYFGAVGPAATYLGLALVLFLAVSAVLWRRTKVAWVLVAVGVISWLCSLSSKIRPYHTADAVLELPSKVLLHVPLISEIIPVRFSGLTGFVAAMLLAISADAWWSWVRGRMDGRKPTHRRRAGRDRSLTSEGARRRLTPAALAAGAALTLVSGAVVAPVGLTYRLPFVIHGGAVPAWFPDVAVHLRPGTEVLTVPYPSGDVADAMGWQAEEGLRWRLVSGYAVVPGRDGRHSAAISPPGGTATILGELSSGLIGPIAVPTPGALRTVRASLEHWHVQVVVVTPDGRDPRYAAGYLTAVLGRAPVVQDGSWVWYGLGSHPPLALAPDALSRCEGPIDLGGPQPPADLSVPECVLSAASTAAATSTPAAASTPVAATT